MSTDANLEDDTKTLTVFNHDANVHYPSQPSARPLLPSPFASAVSGITGVTALGFKVTTKVGGWWIGAAREATLTSLEVARLATEAVLHTVGRDVSQRAHTDLGREEAESVLERTISALHSTISTVSILAASGFYATSASLNSVSALSMHGLGTLNQILGNTESSRAVAAIITLLRDEFNKQDPNDRPIGYFDLVTGTIGFVFLQRWGRRKTELDFRESGGEATIWDTVVDDKGFRADVVGTRKAPEVPRSRSRSRRRASIPLAFLSPADDQENDVVERGTLHDPASFNLSGNDQVRLSDDEIRDHIMSQLPEGAKAVVTSQEVTFRTIKVDIYNSETTHIEAPAGTVMVAESLNHNDSATTTGNVDIPHQTVVFRTAAKRSSSAEIESLNQFRRTTSFAPNLDDDDDVVMMTSPVDTRTEERTDRFHDGSQDEDKAEDVEVITPTPVANQKRSRKPILPARMTRQAPENPPKAPRPIEGHAEGQSKADKGGPFKKALRTFSPTQSSWGLKGIASTSKRDGEQAFSAMVSPNMVNRMTPMSSKPHVQRPLPPRPVSRSTGTTPASLSPDRSRTGSTQTYFAVHESRRDSTVAQTDSYSIHSVESRSGSPTFARTQSRTSNGLTQSKSDVNMHDWTTSTDHHVPLGSPHHHRSRSFVPSLYSMTTGPTEEEIILAPKSSLPRQSIYEDHRILGSLITDGIVPGMFPQQHLVRTVRRFARFSSASYGSNFLRVMGLASTRDQLSQSKELMKLDVHHEHSSFSSHTGLPPKSILLSSFVDAAGVQGNLDWSPSAISPLIHFISIDQESKAVVLTCRGTLGFEDVLTDMTCDFDEFYWQGGHHKVHRGVQVSARRLLGGSGSRVMATLKATLEEYEDFGLVLCGHSLGGAVAAFLAVLIAEPAKHDQTGAFVTARPQRYLTASTTAENNVPMPISLPAGRPIHVYAYGPPATFSESLRVASRGLITTIVNHSDIIPALSLGMLHDFRGVALNLKTDTTGALSQLRQRVNDRTVHAVKGMFYVDQPPPVESIAGDGLGEDTWAWAALKTLRAGMTNQKLVPPGEVFVVETTRVFDRAEYFSPSTEGGSAGTDTATERVYRALGRPATRVQFKLIRDVAGRFGELRFGRSMFSDHSPGRYEANLAALERGILET